MFSPSVENLVAQLTRLPGIGSRTAQRLAFHILQRPKDEALALAAALEGNTLTLEFPQTASFHLKLAEDPKNAAMLREALYEVTGRKLAVEFELGEGGHASEEELHTSEEDVLELMKSTFDARELDE